MVLETRGIQTSNDICDSDLIGFSMISNRELVEIYFKSWNKNNVLQFLRQNLKLPDEVIDSSFDSWIKSFNFHWTKVRSQSRFLERKTDWLNSEFEVR